jgi:ATP-dependent Clp protease protease subunit
MNFGNEFEKYAVKHMGIGSNVVNSVMNHQVDASMTPYILEERNLNVTQMDVFSRLMRDRILFCTGGVDSRMSDIVQAQLLFLDSVEKKDITLYLNTPGGSVLSGLGIVDVMNHVGSDIATVNIGMCASMGSVLLSSGTKGKRSSLLYSKVMTHQVSHGTQGNVQDTRINQLEAEKYNFLLFKLLAKNCGKTFDQMIESSKRDRWFNSDEALEFGLVDEVIGRDEKNSMTNLLDGFEEYYKKEVLS